MKIRIITRRDLERFFSADGAPCPTHVARAAGVSIQSITRVLKGQRKRCGIEVSAKLEPWIFGDSAQEAPQPPEPRAA